MEKQDVVNYLWSIKDRTEIKELWDILKRRNRQIEEQLTVNFNVGEQVKFKGRYGNIETGKIIQINNKTISVKTETTSWRISPSLLEKC